MAIVNSQIAHTSAGQRQWPVGLARGSYECVCISNANDKFGTTYSHATFTSIQLLAFVNFGGHSACVRVCPVPSPSCSLSSVRTRKRARNRRHLPEQFSSEAAAGGAAFFARAHLSSCNSEACCWPSASGPVPTAAGRQPTAAPGRLEVRPLLSPLTPANPISSVHLVPRMGFE